MKASFSVFLLAAGLALTANAAQPNANQPPRRFSLPPGVKALRDLEYGRANNHALRLDLYLPEKPDHPLPLIIWIHGGGWQAGSKDVPSPALPFTAKGYAVAQVGYRLTPEAIFPAQIYDCKAAVRWLRANAAKYNLAPEKFAAWGGSAGGHLVALLGVSEGIVELEGKVNDLKTSSRIQAVVDWYGPTDFLQSSNLPSRIHPGDANSPVAKLLGGPVLDNKDKAAAATPMTYVSKAAPPFLIMHGDQDQVVPISQSESFYEALKKHGVDVTFIPVKGAGHGFRGHDVTRPIEEFLKRCLK